MFPAKIGGRAFELLDLTGHESFDPGGITIPRETGNHTSFSNLSTRVRTLTTSVGGRSLPRVHDRWVAGSFPPGPGLFKRRSAARLVPHGLGHRIASTRYRALAALT